MDKIDIAKQLALITGKPLTNFFEGEIKDEPIRRAVPTLSKEKEEPIGSSSETRSDQKEPDDKEEKITSPESLIEYQKMFKGSKIVGSVILNGRQMTREEYLKYTKGKTYDEIMGHPLMYKMFRAEGQLDPSFMSWPNKFPKVEKDESKEQK
jgi:hypothetical protein